MPNTVRAQAIEAGLAAESVLALLGQLDVQQLPSEERIAVAAVEIEAAEEWLASSLAGVVRPAA